MEIRNKVKFNFHCLLCHIPNISQHFSSYLFSFFLFLFEFDFVLYISEENPYCVAVESKKKIEFIHCLLLLVGHKIFGADKVLCLAKLRGREFLVETAAGEQCSLPEIPLENPAQSLYSAVVGVCSLFRLCKKQWRQKLTILLDSWRQKKKNNRTTRRKIGRYGAEKNPTVDVRGRRNLLHFPKKKWLWLFFCRFGIVIGAVCTWFTVDGRRVIIPAKCKRQRTEKSFAQVTAEATASQSAQRWHCDWRPCQCKCDHSAQTQTFIAWYFGLQTQFKSH